MLLKARGNGVARCAVVADSVQTKRDLGFVEGDLIECLNAGDGQWWMGRLRRNKAVGLFPSNYVEVLENYQRPGIHPPKPASRNASPSRLGPDGDRGRVSRATSPAPSTRSRRGTSPHPPAHDRYGGEGGSSRSRTGRSRSPAPGHQRSISRAASPSGYNRAASPNPCSRAASPNPYNRAVSPAPSFGVRDMRRVASPAPSHYRAASPAPSRNYQRAASPNPYGREDAYRMPRATSPTPSQHCRAMSPAPPWDYKRAASPNPYAKDEMMQERGDSHPPAPPPHRANRRAASPLPLPTPDGRLTPMGSRAQTPNGQTPSPLRNAMEDVMERLEHMSSYDDRPRTPQTPWSPESFGEIYAGSPTKRHIRPETSLGIAGRNEYEDEEDENGIPLYPSEPPMPVGYAERMEDRLRRFQEQPRRDSEVDIPPPTPAKFSSYSERPRSGDPTLKARNPAFDLRYASRSASPAKMVRPRPLTRVETLSSNSTSNHSSATASTAMTSASIMSGMSAGGFSATSAGSLAKRKHKSIGTIEGTGRNSPRPVSTYGTRAETPSGYLASGSGFGSGSGTGTFGRKRGQTWGTTVSTPADGVFGGLVPPKPKKANFFKKILNSAKTSAASIRGMDEIPVQSRTVQSHGQDWVQVRRDVNRSNTLSRNERIERQEKQQMMDQPVLRPADALDEDVDGDEAADGGIVTKPQDFEIASLALVDKAARFITSLPPFTTPESLATHQVCRPYRSDVQRLRAIFTWIAERIAWEHPRGPIDGEYGPQSIDTRRVLAQRRGAPEEVAAVVQGMCAAVGISCDVIRGFLKAPGEAVDFEACPRANHWWNAVVVDGEWRFMDCSLASPTHPRRYMYSSAPANQAEFFYFLTKPSEFVWTHIPVTLQEQHLVPPLPLPILMALPCACPPFFKHGLQMINYDTSLIRMENLEVVQVEFSVPPDIECVAEVEANGFAIDQNGDVFETGEVVKKRALAQPFWENGVKTYRVKAVLPGDEGQGVLKVYVGPRGLMVCAPYLMLMMIPLLTIG